MLNYYIILRFPVENAQRMVHDMIMGNKSLNSSTLKSNKEEVNDTLKLI